jgi:3-oxoacyl-[acyl-carrier-protein] synthase-1/3-oxoacyl-[acyl-carrier-protein] synthase II
VSIARAAVIAFGAISPLGEGESASGVAARSEAAFVAIREDEELVRSSFARPFAARVPPRGDPSRDRADVVLERALASCAAELDVVRPGWRASRVGLALGTSSGGMRSAEILFERHAAGAPIDVDTATAATYFAGMSVALPALGLAHVAPTTLVLTACSASTLAIGLGTRWLEAGTCDLVLAGGYDAVSVFVAAGFEVLRATSVQVPPRPFCVGRDGMAVGEGACVLALVRPAELAPTLTPHALLLGFGASSDAVHLTAPDRTGDGLARAATRALQTAGLTMDAPPIDLVSPHATATPFNDAAESKALAATLGASARPVIHPLKAQIGHTMGAAGALETLACIHALQRGIHPASASHENVETDLGGRLLPLSEAGDPRLALKLSAAFGGANAALVVARADVGMDRARALPPPSRRTTFVTRAVVVDALPSLAELAARTGHAEEKLARGDGLVRFAIAAVEGLRERVGAAALEGAGVIVGHSLATLETNALFASRMRSRGVRMSEPRRFPYTTPNAVAGECGVVFGLRGPGLAVGSGLHGSVEALAIASDLVASGDADAMVVVAVDEIGDTARALLHGAGWEADYPLRSGAVALLVTSDRTHAVARIAATTLAIDATSSPSAARTPSGAGHLALRALADAEPPAEVVATSPGGFTAAVELTRL